MNHNELKDFLEHKYQQFNTPEFIANDPISIPHMFNKQEDIEVSAFLSATIAWGQRPVIVKNAKELMKRMDFQPYEFCLNASRNELEQLQNFKHRTFNEEDCRHFILSLKNIYQQYGTMENLFTKLASKQDIKDAIVGFRNIFLSISHPKRMEKHIANPAKGSSAKRINMFLKWMVRKDHSGVDFGLWKNISPSWLYCPLDVHSGNVARSLGLLTRKQNDWKAVEELTDNLRKLDAADPVKYDYALFGLGIFENFC